MIEAVQALFAFVFTRILPFVFVFCVVATVHELGHFLAAKRFGVRVETFSIGFGPKLFSWLSGSTEYQLCLLPLLAYVKLAGMEPDDIDAVDGVARQPKLPRLIIFSAGPLANLALALVVFWIGGMTIGIPGRMSNRVYRIKPGSEAERIGLKPGDKIVAINGRSILDGEQMIQTIHSSPGKQLTLVIDRRGKRIQKKATPERTVLEGKKIGLLGFNPQPLLERAGFFKSISFGFQQTYYITVEVLRALPRSLLKIISGNVPKDVGGPVAIAQVAGQAASRGFGSLFMFIAFISVNLAVFNLFPFPVLDGGHIALLAIETLRGKRLDPNKEHFIHLVGFALLMGLMVILVYTDLTRGVPGQ